MVIQVTTQDIFYSSQLQTTHPEQLYSESWPPRTKEIYSIQILCKLQTICGYTSTAQHSTIPVLHSKLVTKLATIVTAVQ